MAFRWNDWNLDKVARHAVRPEAAEQVVRTASRPWPRRARDRRVLVWGPTNAGRLLQIVYVLDVDDTVSVIHGRPLNETEKQRYRRWRRN